MDILATRKYYFPFPSMDYWQLFTNLCNFSFYSSFGCPIWFSRFGC